MLHPDERNIANAVAKIKFFSDLNPEFFAYNSFPIYLYKAIGYVLAVKETKPDLNNFLASLNNSFDFSFLDLDSAWTSDWSKINLIGRFISALAATIFIYFLFLIGKEIFGEVLALFSTLYFVFTPSLIQQAHFGVTESLLVFFFLAISFFSIKLLKEKKKIYWLPLTIFSGLSLACKISAPSFLIIPFLSWLILVWQERKFLEYLKIGIVFLVFTFFVFFIFSPYTILDFKKFRESIEYEHGVASGSLKVPYNWQFHDTKSYLFQWLNLHWQTNIFLPTLGFLGAIFWLIFMILKKEKIYFLPTLAFFILYFGYVGSWYTKFIRYTIPLIPVLVLTASWLIFQILKFPRLKLLGILFLILVSFSSIFWGIAFFSIYTKPHTRISASKWIFENAPSGSVLLHEHWDDRLPAHLSGENPFQYTYLEMKNYDADTPEKISEMAENLAKGDFVILSSRRLLGSIGKNPQEWPITSKYYQKLFGGELGYQLVQIVSSYPKIFNFEIKDDAAEETFQVYDHPTIWIFKNEKRFL